MNKSPEKFLCASVYEVVQFLSSQHIHVYCMIYKSRDKKKTPHE